MPRLVSFRLALACALALLLALSTAAATAKGPTVSLRVIGAHGKVLAERSVGAAATKVKTSPKANCLGAGTGGSGQTVKVKAKTALAALARASKRARALRPLLITDHFRPEFGLGLCGVGKSRSTSTLSWYLKVNHKDPQVGGEQATVEAGDEVLWALAPYPYPEELVLRAPSTVKVGKPFQVTVTAYDDSGKHKPAEGVTVTGASEPTGQNGKTTVTVNAARALVLRARRGADIPSRAVTVCVEGAGVTACS
jgi:hypothetical protein